MPRYPANSNLLVVLLALGLVGAMGFIQPSATSTEAAQELAGTSELTVSGSGTAVVNIPEDVFVSLTGSDNPNLSLETEADAAAAVLVGSDGATLVWSRITPDVLCTDSSPSSCAELLSALQVLGADLEDPPGSEHARVVPAGRYDLHVVSTDDSAPTTATITADELLGAVSLDSTTKPIHEFSVLSDMSPTMGAGVVSAGASDEIAEDGGTLFHFIAATGSLTASAEIGNCIYSGTPPISSPLAYAPPCPTGDTTGIRFLGAGNVFTYALAGLQADVSKGTWSHGGYVAGPMLADDGVVVNLWLG